MTSAERVYRAALRAYPRAYRESRGEEIVATLLEPHPDRVDLAEAASLVLAGLRERNRTAATEPGGIWWPALAALAPILASVTAAIALAGLWVAASRSSWPGFWWAAFAVVAVALAVAAAARVAAAALPLAVALFGLVALDALKMAGNGRAVPHLRLLEDPTGEITRVGDVGIQTRFSASVPSNPTEIVPLALILLLGCVGLFLARAARPAPRARATRASASLVLAGAAATVAVLDPTNRFAFLLVPAIVAVGAALLCATLYVRAGVVALALAVAVAPSAFWRSSAGADIERWESGGVTQVSTQRGVVPGLVAVAALGAAALVAAALARRAQRRAEAGEPL